MHGLRPAGTLAVLAGLLVIPQSYIAADALGSMAADTVPLMSALAAAMLYAAFGILRHLLDASGGRIAFRAAQMVVAEERRALIASQSRLSPLSQDGLSSAEGAFLIANKLDLMPVYLARYQAALRKTKVLPLFILIATAWASWAAALILLVAGPLIPLFMALIGFAARDASAQHLKEAGSLNALLLERLNAMVDIKLLDGRATMVEQFFDSANALKDRTMAVLRIAFLSSTVLELFSALGIAMVAVYVGFSLLGVLDFGTVGAPLTLAQGIFILLLAPEFFAPLRELANAWHDRAAALAVAEELEQVDRGLPTRILGEGVAAERLSGAMDLNLSDVSVCFEGGAAIRYPDLEIRAGETVAITGASGTGKSTLLALLAGLLPASRGVITIGGRVLDDGLADEWRQCLAWVAQTPHFSNASLMANIVDGQGPRDEARMTAALEMAGLSSVVACLPQGLGTRLGETGSRLSGGEARRVVLARAFYSDADVIFADEPTADLDAATADLVTQGLLALAAQGRTLIVATHDRRLVERLGREIRLGDLP